MILLSHPTGNENVRNAALALQEAQLLAEFWTCLSWNPESPINHFLPRRLRDQFSRRAFPPPVRPFIRTVPLLETSRLFFGFSDIDSVLLDLDRKVAARLRKKSDFRGVYAYEDGAAETFRIARDRGIRRIYDLPIGYWRVAQQIYAEEREREPEWAPTLTGMRDSDEKLARKDEELEIAERVVVASSFTRDTLKEANFAGEVSLIPYGAPSVSSEEPVSVPGKLRVLFAGSLGQRKGLAYLLRAIELLGDRTRLTLLGRKPAEGCRPLEQAVRQHRWIPSLPHNEVLAEMRQHDVLVLPSLFEGFGLVILEAMAQGLVVIATPHTAAPDLIDDGRDGYVVPIRSAESITERLESLLQDPERLQEMRLAARRKAHLQRWDVYRQSLARLARELVF